MFPTLKKNPKKQGGGGGRKVLHCLEVGGKTFGSCPFCSPPARNDRSLSTVADLEGGRGAGARAPPFLAKI